MLDDPRHPLQRKGEHLGLRNAAEGAIQDEIALIGDEGLPALIPAQSNLARAASFSTC